MSFDHITNKLLLTWFGKVVWGHHLIMDNMDKGNEPIFTLVTTVIPLPNLAIIEHAEWINNYQN